VCAVAAIKGVTACQAASAAARERPSGLPGFAVATPGVSHRGVVDLAVRPVSVATDVDLQFGIRTRLGGSGRIVNEWYVVVVSPRPTAGASASLGSCAAPVIREQMTASILAGLAPDLEAARRPDTTRIEAPPVSD